jgi:hypothetical protein
MDRDEEEETAAAETKAEEEDKIRERYFNAGEPGSFGSFQSFVRNSKFKDLNAVKQTLGGLRTFSVHRGKRRETQRRSIVPLFKGEFLAADLAQMTMNHPRLNGGTNYILVIRELLSKMLYLFPLKRKDGPSLAAAFETFFKENPEYRNCRIHTDMGLEFRNKNLTEVLQRYGSKIYFTLNMKLKSVYR